MSINGLAQEMRFGFKEVHGAIVKTNESIENLAVATKKGFDSVSERFDAVDERFDKVETRLGAVESGLDGIKNLLIRDHDNRIERLEDKVRMLNTLVTKK